MKKHSGFTLAEVLLTLAIIGVVAAMTVPSLMNSTEDKKLGAAAKKAYNTLQNAITMKQALTELTPSDLTGATLLPNLVGEGADKVQVIKYNSKTSDNTIVETPDGIIMVGDGGTKSCDTKVTDGAVCAITADVNGAGGPTFSGITTGTNAQGAAITALTTRSANTTYAKANRDIVRFLIDGMNVVPDINDAVTARYIGSKVTPATP